MLRFGRKPPPPTPSIFGGASRGVWKLLLLLGLVIVMIRQLQRPEAGVMLGRVLGIANQPGAEVVAPIAGADRVEAPAANKGRDDRAAAPPLDEAWDAVKDNAMFSPREQDAWFQLFQRVRDMPPTELAGDAVGVVYAQLINQPDAYRAKPVRVRGRVLRESLKQAPANEAGIESYHQLWLAPVGGGNYPFLIYSLELPEGFPRGDDIAADVTVSGLFFKNYTYAYEGGMGLAPVVVARNVQWVAPAAKPPLGHELGAEWQAAGDAGAIDSQWVIVGVGGAALAAAGFVAWAMRQTRRQRMRRDEAAVDLSHLEAGP